MSRRAFCSSCGMLTTIAGIIFSPLAIMAYWWWIDYAAWNPFGGPPEVQTHQPTTVDIFGHPRSVFAATEPVGVRLRYDVYRDRCPRYAEYWLRYPSGKLSFLGEQRRGETSGRGNGSRDWVKQFKFDANGHVGRHTAEIRVFWQCNPLREYPVIYRADFQVID